MQYKTIMLQLLEQQPDLYHQLRRSRQLLPALDQYANQLKTLHESWKETLVQASPERDGSQVSSEALEMAIQELEGRLPTVYPQDDQEPLSLDKAMAFVRIPTPKK